MAKFKVGDEVTEIDASGSPIRITKIVKDRLGNGWTTEDGTWWTRSGLEARKGAHRRYILPTTAEHRRTIWLRETRCELSRDSPRRVATDATIEAVARLLGLAIPS